MKIRASTQLNDDLGLLMTEEQQAALAAAIRSLPETGEYTIVKLKLNADKVMVIEYEDTPVA